MSLSSSFTSSSVPWCPSSHVEISCDEETPRHHVVSPLSHFSKFLHEHLVIFKTLPEQEHTHSLAGYYQEVPQGTSPQNFLICTRLTCFEIKKRSGCKFVVKKCQYPERACRLCSTIGSPVRQEPQAGRCAQIQDSVVEDTMKSTFSELSLLIFVEITCKPSQYVRR